MSQLKTVGRHPIASRNQSANYALVLGLILSGCRSGPANTDTIQIDGSTLVIVTHNMQQATRISDKTAFFSLGKLIEYADTKQLFSQPANPETQRYLAGKFG